MFLHRVSSGLQSAALSGADCSPRVPCRELLQGPTATHSVHTKAVPRQLEALEWWISFHCIDYFWQKLSSRAFKQPAEGKGDFCEEMDLQYMSTPCASIFHNCILQTAPAPNPHARTKLPSSGLHITALLLCQVESQITPRQVALPAHPVKGWCALQVKNCFIAETADTSLQDLPAALLLHWHKDWHVPTLTTPADLLQMSVTFG